MKQLFSIGESVIRQAQNYPEGNGIYTITSIITKQEYEEKYPEVLSWKHFGEEVYYGLEGFSVDLTSPRTGAFVCTVKHTAQGNLRKRYERGDFSFTELVQYLSTKIVEKI